MQNANLGHTTAAPDILKTSNGLIFFIDRNDMQSEYFNIFHLRK